MNDVEPARALEIAIAEGRFDAVDALLDQDASLRDAHLGLQLAFVREDAVRAALAADPGAAVRRIGRRDPIHHLCFSQIHRRDPSASAAKIRLLDALLAAGADVNATFPFDPENDASPLSALYGALGHAGDLTLAEAMLERGADPNDGESLYHATELPTLDGVKLLFAHGAQVAGTNAFLRMLDFNSAEGAALFLANGADPNEAPVVASGDPPAASRNALHHAIIRNCSVDICRAVLDAGADATVPRRGRSPYALAKTVGASDVAALLAARGFETDLSDVERFLAAIAVLDEAAARAALDADPDLIAQLAPEDVARQSEIAEHAESLPVLSLMADLGFDPNHLGAEAMPPIHVAAWHGRAETVRMYCARGVALETENDYGGTALGTAIHGSAYCPGRADGDYAGCVQALLDAGAIIRPEAGHLEMGDPAVNAQVAAAQAARERSGTE